MPALRAIAKVRAAYWVGLTAAILAIDYATGPHVQFAILFVFPVALATAAHGRRIGILVAALLPLMRLWFLHWWQMPSSLAIQILDAGIDVAILVVTSVLIDKVVRQERELQVLEGLLPICSFCKRIRDEEGRWRQLEGYISARSGARFSHTFCHECGSKHYSDLVE
jgi:hypothetical protein